MSINPAGRGHRSKSIQRIKQTIPKKTNKLFFSTNWKKFWAKNASRKNRALAVGTGDNQNSLLRKISEIAKRIFL